MKVVEEEGRGVQVRGKTLLPGLQTIGRLEQTPGGKADQQLGGRERRKERIGRRNYMISQNDSFFLAVGLPAYVQCLLGTARLQ